MNRNRGNWKTESIERKMKGTNMIIKRGMAVFLAVIVAFSTACVYITPASAMTVEEESTVAEPGTGAAGGTDIDSSEKDGTGGLVPAESIKEESSGNEGGQAEDPADSDKPENGGFDNGASSGSGSGAAGDAGQNNAAGESGSGAAGAEDGKSAADDKSGKDSAADGSGSKNAGAEDSKNAADIELDKDAEPESAVTETPVVTVPGEESTVEMPGAAFIGSTGLFKDGSGNIIEIKVTAEAGEGVFPAGTAMDVKLVSSDAAVNEAVEKAVEESDKIEGVVSEMQAVDITFSDEAGNKIEPKGPVKVTLSSGFIDEKEEPVLIHIPDEQIAKMPGPESEVVAQEERTPENGKQDDEIIFVSDEFSVYAIVYTVDFHYGANGNTYNFSIPGGGVVTLAQLVELLGLSEGNGADVASGNAAGITRAGLITLDDVEITDAAREFVSEVESVTFSDPSLAWVGKINETSTVAKIKEANGLKPEYSADITKLQKLKIDAQTVEAGDWAFISLAPFESEETLTVTMTNGDSFKINVTDANGEPDADLTVNSVDYEGNEISLSEFGSGYELYFYELPAAELGAAFTNTEYLTSLTTNQLRNALYRKGADALAQYAGHITINSRQVTDYQITMEDGATEENPYILIFMGDEDSMKLSPLIMPEWVGCPALWYDGNEINICGDSASKEGENRYVISIKHDNSLFSPKVTFKFDTSSYNSDGVLYPATIAIEGADTPVTVEADGEYAVTLPAKISRNELNARPAGVFYPFGAIGYSVTLQEPDRFGWEAAANDDIHNDSAYIGKQILMVDVDADDNLLGINMGSSGPTSAGKLVITYTKNPDTSKVSVNVHTTDYDGNTITEEELGSGYDLYYIEAPLSVITEGYSGTYTINDLRNGNSSISLSRYNVLSGSDSGLVKYNEYFKTVHITSPDQAASLSMPEDASSANPYVLFFVGDKNRIDLFSEWNTETGNDNNTQFFYDGEKLYRYKARQNAVEASSSTPVTVRHDDSMVEAKFTVKFDASEYIAAGGSGAYPVTCFVMYDNNSGIYQPDDVIGKGTANADGEIEITLDRKLSRNVMSRDGWDYLYTYLKLADESGDVIQQQWKASANDGQTGTPARMPFNIHSVDENGYIHGQRFNPENGTYETGADPVKVTYTRFLEHNKLRISTYDIRKSMEAQEPALITEEDLGDGYDLVYYEIPASVWGEEFTRDHILDEPYYPQSALTYPNGYGNSIDYSPYKKTVHIDSNTVETDIFRNAAATADVPYAYVFIGSDRELNNYSYYLGEWDCHASYLYDGEQVYPLQNAETDGNFISISVQHDDSIIKPKLKVQLDSSDFVSKSEATNEEIYPITVNISSYNSFLIGTGSAEATEDGEVEIVFDSNYSVLRQGSAVSMNPAAFRITIEDESATSGYGWYLKNTELLAPNAVIEGNSAVINCVGVDEDGYLHTAVQGEYNEQTHRYEWSSGDVCVPVFEKRMGGVRPAVMFQLVDSSHAAEEDELPVYVMVTAEDCYDSSWRTTKTVKVAAEDLNKAITLQFDRFDPYLDGTTGHSSRPLTFYFSVYTDEACTELAEGWGSGGTDEWYWMENYDLSNNVWGYQNWDYQSQKYRIDPLQIYYNFVRPEVPVSAFTNDASLYPAYLKVEGFGQTHVLKLEKNGESVVTFDKVRLDNIWGQEITWSVYEDEECTTLHDGWSVDGRSETIAWNGEYLVLSSDYMNPFAIDLSVITADSISVPMSTELGDLAESDFLPVYMKAVLTSDAGAFEPVEITRKLESLSDANEALVFEPAEGDVFDSSSGYLLDVQFFKDEECTESAGYLWSDYSANSRLWGDEKLHDGVEETALIYRPVTVKVDPDNYRVPVSETEPVYLKTTISGIGGDPEVTDIRTITDLEERDVTVKHLGYVGKYFSVETQLNENEDFDGHPITSLGTQWFDDSSEGNLAVSGKLMKAADGGGTEDILLKPYEGPYRKLFTVPVEIHIPEDGNYSFRFGNSATGAPSGGYEQAISMGLYRVSPNTGNMEYVTIGENGSADDYYPREVYKTLATLEDWKGDLNFYINAATAGSYYLRFAMVEKGTYNNWVYNYYVDSNWTNEVDIPVTITDDGQILFEDGTPVKLDFYFVQRALPNFDVHAEYPDGSEEYGGNSYQANLARTSENEYTPRYFHYEFRSVKNNDSYSYTIHLRTGAQVNGEMIANIPEGDSVISTPMRRYNYLNYLYYTYQRPDLKPEDYSYDDVPVIAANYPNSGYYYSNAGYRSVGNESQYGYFDQYVQGFPVGDYYLTYYIGSDVEIRDKWEYVREKKVHIAEDGKMYAIDDEGNISDEPLVMNIRYVADSAPVSAHFDALKIKVKTELRDGVDPQTAFKEGDTFAVTVTEWRNNNSMKENYATGTAKITEAGTIEMELTNPDGGQVILHSDAAYNVSFGTFHDFDGSFDTSSVNKAWLTYNNTRNRIYFSDYYSSPGYGYMYPAYFTADNVDEDGYIHGYTYVDNGAENEDYCYWMNDADREILTIDNLCMIIPWEETDPGTIAQDTAEDAVVFKPISDITSIKEKGRYIIVAENKYNNKWYALYVDENGGNSVELTDVHSLADLEAGYKTGSTEAFSKMIFTGSKVTAGSDSVSLQLKTSYKGADGKSVALKMGESSQIPKPLLSGSAGTVIVRSAIDEKQFTVSKGNYSALWYVDELYGWTGFRTVSNRYGAMYTYRYDYSELIGLVMASNHVLYGTGTPYGNGYAVLAGVNDDYNGTNRFMVDVDSKYLNNAYYSRLQAVNSSYPGLGGSQFYILSDDVEEVIPPQPTNQYTLVKTFGDFVRTFSELKNEAAASNMILVYTDDTGKEYAMDPAGLTQVLTKAGGSGYRTLTTVADHELIPNNNSGTSAHFNVAPTEIKNEGRFVFTTPYGFRKSRQNNTEDRNYLTMNGTDTAWGKNDDATHGEGLVYVLHPSVEVNSQADWDSPQNYKLSVVRNGETHWLGIAEDENGKMQMVTVDDESQAVSFTIYSSMMKRYYSSAYGTDLYRYYRVYNITDINAGDEILIVYDDNGTKRLMAYPFTDYVYNQYSYNYLNETPAVEVLSEYSVLDTRDHDLDEETKYKYRLGTTEYIKKPFAYIDSEDDAIIWAQGISANAIGTAKSETSKQRKYNSVDPLGNQSASVYIKTGFGNVYGSKQAETNFFPAEEDGEFYIRGGKSDAWVGTGTYQRSMLNIATGRYEPSGTSMEFVTVGTADRIPVEIYRRPAVDATFTVAYYTADGEYNHMETKPQDSFSLTQESDVKVNDNDYIFVGWTTDPEKAGYLTLSDSANIYDFDDLAKLASVKSSVKEEYGLLGDCNPEIGNMISYEEVADKVEENVTLEGKTLDKVLKVYPVYAVRGYSAAVTANDKDTFGNDRMIVGASDFKDLQNGGTGTTDIKERWLGSINIEVYKDGELWVPGAGGSTTGRKLMAATPPVKATLYFAYHNDDAADLNIKFIADSVTQDTLYEYMSSSDFSEAEPSEHYLIDAVYAEQGGSEDGLKYRLNWMDDVVGGQLDNVRGGSTVKIYVTTKYQVKYYLDSGDGNGYQLLTGDVWTNPNYYTTPGTENAVAAAEETADYVMTTDPETSFNMNLIERTPSDGTTFKDEKMIRGEYSEFLYKFNEYIHEIPIARLPEEAKGEIPEGSVLEAPGDAGDWVIRDKELARITDWTELTKLPVTLTTYGTGNSIWSYKGADDGTNTYHLYAKVVTEEPGVPLPFTGGTGTKLFTVLGAILVLAAAGWMLARKRRMI